MSAKNFVIQNGLVVGPLTIDAATGSVSTPGSVNVGGETIYTFFVASGQTNSQDLSKVRDIGNSILGGSTSNTVPNIVANIYPDGPDILTVCVTPLAVNAAVAAQLNWTEAQA